MKTAEKAKAIGFKNLDEAAELSGRSADTLRYMDKNNPELLDAVLRLALEKKLN